MNRKIIRYIFAIFFILCGLIIGIIGSYGCIVTKHYKGDILLGTPLALELEAAYPDAVEVGQIHLQYDILDTKLLDLPYTTNRGLLWLFIPIGLGYTVLGVAILLKEDLIFRKG